MTDWIGREPTEVLVYRFAVPLDAFDIRGVWLQGGSADLVIACSRCDWRLDIEDEATLAQLLDAAFHHTHTNPPAGYDYDTEGLGGT